MSPTANHESCNECVLLHLERVSTYSSHCAVMYEVRGLAAETRRNDITAGGNISGSLSTWMFHLQHISQSETILLPMTYFNV